MGRTPILFLFCLLLASVYGFCDYSDEKGNKYDFSGLSGKDVTFEGIGMFFALRFCNVVAFDSECSAKGGALCAYDRTTHVFYNNLARWQKNNGPTITSKVAGGLVISFSNGDPLPSSAQPIVNLHLSCGEATTPVIDSDANKFEVTMTHPVGCPVADSGLSGGAIFLIVLLCLTAVYTLGGCAYNLKVKGTPFGLASCPQRDFWCGLPGLVKDGFVFIGSKVGLCKRNVTSNETTDSYGTMA